MDEHRNKSLFRPQSETARIKRGLFGYPAATLTLVIGIAVTLSVFFQAQHLEYRAAVSQLRRDTSDIRHILSTGIENKLNSLSALRSLFAASREVNLAEFRIFSDHLQRRFKEIEAFEWIPLVMRQDVRAFELRARRDLGLEGLSIFGRDQDGKRVPPEERPEHYPVLYVEPFDRNLAAIGHDQFSRSGWSVSGAELTRSPGSRCGGTGSTRRRRPRWTPWGRRAACVACTPCRTPRTGSA